jgi:hypothetical protein
MVQASIQELKLFIVSVALHGLILIDLDGVSWRIEARLSVPLALLNAVNILELA